MMGYHNNEQALKKCVGDAVRFINDRARLQYGLEVILFHMDYDWQFIDQTILDIRNCNFEKLNEVCRKYERDME
jgi:hypothetical protein